MERGWGGPIAIVVALIVMYLVKLGVDHWLKIDNPSPAEDWEEGEEVNYQLTDAEGAGEGNCGGVDVDHGSWRSYKPCVCGRCDMTPRTALP